MHILTANQNLFKTWYANALESHGSLVARIPPGSPPPSWEMSKWMDNQLI